MSEPTTNKVKTNTPVENQPCECRSCILKAFVHIDHDTSIELSKEPQKENPKEKYECTLSEPKCESIETKSETQMAYVNSLVDSVIKTLEQEYAEAQAQEEPPQCICADGYEDKRRCKYCTDS